MIGRTLRELREAAGLTQDRLADLTGITAVYASELESGRRNPSYLVLSRILRALGVTWTELGARLDALASPADDAGEQP
ncbi:MAG TPA: helix-turn-helix transcriptional regulator [Gemmatimonadaceae bacterium]|nr:helix-turn-helix transcriptional regulator [Gemmatimonadaceae bacterium]